MRGDAWTIYGWEVRMQMVKGGAVAIILGLLALLLPGGDFLY